MTIGLAIDLWNNCRRFDRDFYRTLFADAGVSSPGRAGSKNGAVTWSGGIGGPFLNPYCGCLLNTNYILRSQEFDNAAWTKSNASVTAAQAAPDGTLTAFKFVSANGFAGQLVSTAVAKSASAAQVWTGSVFLKAGARTSAKLQLDAVDGTNVAYLSVNLTTGVVSGITIGGSFTACTGYAYAITGQTGWWRVVITATTGAEASLRFKPIIDSVGTGVEDLYAWGTQLEPGNVATDYVPTMGAAQAHCVYSRQALPGFTVPVKPQVVGTALDRPFRHDYRIGYNLVVNSAWDGAVAGSPGTAPTGWTAGGAGTGEISSVNAGAVAVAALALNDRKYFLQTVTVAANTLYTLSARVLAATGAPQVREVAALTALPAGATTAYFINGGAVASTATVASGDTITLVLTVVATAGTAVVRLGIGCTGTSLPASSVTLTEPQVEPGTVRSVYTPTTTAAIQAVVCEPVKATEDGIFALFHAQGARTNLCSPMVGNDALASITLAGVARTLTENGAVALHDAYSGAIALTNGTQYVLRAKLRRSVGARNAVLYVGRTGHIAGVAINLDTGVLTSVSVGATLSGQTATRSADGLSWLVSFGALDAAWGGNVLVVGGLSSNGTSLDSYQGDGVSGVVFEAVTLEAATVPGLPLGESVALTAQTVTHNAAALTSPTAGETFLSWAPYLWSTVAGGDNPSATSIRYIYTAGFSIYRLSSGGFGYDAMSHTDAAGAQGSNTAAPAETSGVARTLSMKWETGALRLYRGTVLAVSDVAGLTPPWTGYSARTISLGLSGATGWVETNGRTFTAAERSLLASGFARTLSYAA